MGSLIGSCVGSCCAGIACAACKDCQGSKYGPISRLPYIFLFFLAGVFSIVMSLYGEKELNLKITQFSLCNSDTCKGNGSVFRTSFILFIFELIHVLIIGSGLIKFHYLFFIFKFIIFIIGLTLTFIIEPKQSDTFFDDWSTAARYFSAVYLVLQLLILITLGYDINDYLQTKAAEKNDSNPDIDPEEQKKSCNLWLTLMVLISFGLYVFSFTLLGLFYKWYGKDGCELHKSLITTTIILVIITALLSIGIGHGNFFVSAIICTYTTFILWVGIQADPNENCNVFAHQRNTLSLWLGFLITFIALFYAALRANLLGSLAFRENENIDNNDDDDGTSVNNKDTMKSPLLNKNSDAETGNKSVNNDEYGSNYDDVDIDEKKVRVPSQSNADQVNDSADEGKGNITLYKKQNTYFHVVMTLAAAYFAMAFTNWGTNKTDITTVGKNAMWVNMATQWVCFILFWWTMVAPKACPSRFGITDSE